VCILVYRKIFLLSAAFLIIFSSRPVVAGDPEGCLVCHRYRGLSRLDADTGELRLFFCSEEYYAYQLGPHARLQCTDCHLQSEVAIIPHRVKTPVNCTNECHVTSPEWLEKRFSHKDVLASLDQSAHNHSNLSDLPFDPPLLRPGQSYCLYCHDEPLFSWPLEHAGSAVGNEDIHRCQTCHQRELPIDMAYYVRHFGSRLQPARPARQLAQVCAVCHSDLKFIEQTQGHDTIASYLHSFHGKAKLLGSTQTATCLDCHVGDFGNAHAMLSKDDPASAVHPSRVADTCRSVRCHPGASPAMGTAAVHLPLDPHARTIEYYVAAFFVILTAVVMTLFLLIIMLELLAVVTRRHSPEEHRLTLLAQQILKDPEGKKLLKRLTPHQRIQHWLLAVTFTGLVYTGMCIKFADMPWSAHAVNWIGGLSIARNIHRLCGVTMLVGFGYHILYIALYFVRQMRRARREGRKTSLIKLILDAPMMIRLTDFKDMFRLLGYLVLIRKERPRFHQFNFMEKFEYWAVTWGCLMIGASGAMLWATEWTSEHFSGRALNFAFIIHSDEAYLAFIYIAVVHMFTIIFSPTVFPLSRGTITGDAPARELAEWHSAKVEEVARKLNIKLESAHPPQNNARTIIRQIVTRTYGAVLLALAVAICFVSMRYLFTTILYREAAPTEIVEIPKRLDAEILRVQPQELLHPVGMSEPLTRGPLAHFHQIPPWFQPDPANGCTISGCHAPLPHGQRIETRSFLNMHTTFLDCEVCHVEHAQKPLQVDWYDLNTAQQHATPAVLRLDAFLERADLGDNVQAPAINEWLIQLLSEALTESGENPQLKTWLLHLETTNPQSKLWHSIVENIRSSIGMHLHGEYNAKIALSESGAVRSGMSKQQNDAAREYLKSKDKLAQERKNALLHEVHQSVSKTGLQCTPCHNVDAALIDFESLGYSSQRVLTLKNSPIARQMEMIQQGREFLIGPHHEPDQ
jgi:cytochrome b subunit of formate dehydrogenase